MFTILYFILFYKIEFPDRGPGVRLIKLQLTSEQLIWNLVRTLRGVAFGEEKGIKGGTCGMKVCEDKERGGWVDWKHPVQEATWHILNLGFELWIVNPDFPDG